MFLSGEAWLRDDCSIPADPEWLRRVIRWRFPDLSHPKRYTKHVETVVREHFSEPHEGSMRCIWLHAQFMEAAETSQTKSNNARCRWEKLKQNKEAADAAALQQSCNGNARVMRGEESRGEERDKTRKTRAARANDSDFDSPPETFSQAKNRRDDDDDEIPCD
jgi:hypothetical protein